MLAAFWEILSPTHLLLIGIVAILLFGNRLPEVARSLGRSVNEFKRGLKEVKDDFDEAAKGEPEEKPKEKLEAPKSEGEANKIEPGRESSEPAEPQESHAKSDGFEDGTR
jgi:sec-independent protein translocase protein TatA